MLHEVIDKDSQWMLKTVRKLIQMRKWGLQQREWRWRDVESFWTYFIVKPSRIGVYFRELAHAVVETGKPQIRRVDNQAGDPRK